MAEGKYVKSIRRLEEILGKIENEEIDVDELADRVKEAVTLIKECKQRIEKAQMDVKKVVEDLDDSSEDK